MFNRFSILKLKLTFIIVLFLSLPGIAQTDEEGDETVLDTVVVSGSEEFVFDSIAENPQAVVIHQLPDSVYDNLRKDGDYWYVNLPPPRPKPKAEKEKEPDTDWMESKAVRNIILVLIIAVFLAALIWFLASSDIKLFEKPKKILEDENAPVTEEDLFRINFQDQIYRAIQEGNFRLATRLWYLQTLKELTERGLIQYRHEKTNTEYLDELYQTKFYREFMKLTRNFEYVWYGKFDLNETTYRKVENEFAEFNRLLRS